MVAEDAVRDWESVGKELEGMLRLKNGFYAYESALLVRPFRNASAPLGLVEWNSPQLWKANYAEELSNALFFAEDVFGGQYCIHENKICTFEPETGLISPMSASLDDWASEGDGRLSISDGASAGSRLAG